MEKEKNGNNSSIRCVLQRRKREFSSQTVIYFLFRRQVIRNCYLHNKLIFTSLQLRSSAYEIEMGYISSTGNGLQGSLLFYTVMSSCFPKGTKRARKGEPFSLLSVVHSTFSNTYQTNLSIKSPHIQT